MGLFSGRRRDVEPTELAEMRETTLQLEEVAKKLDQTIVLLRSHVDRLWREEWEPVSIRSQPQK